jgi:hypothetical protein
LLRPDLEVGPEVEVGEDLEAEEAFDEAEDARDDRSDDATTAPAAVKRVVEPMKVDTATPAVFKIVVVMAAVEISQCLDYIVLGVD